VVLAAALPSVLGAQAPSAGGATAPLTVKATCDAPTEVMHLQIANQSNRPTSVVLGFNAAVGGTHVVNSVTVIAIRPATGAEEEYVYVNGKHAREYDKPKSLWVVSLAPGATHELDLPLKEFISTLNFSSLDPAVAGGTRLVVEGRAASTKTTPVWIGKVDTRVDACR